MTTDQDIQGDELLEERVDQLVNQIEQVSSQFHRAMSEDPDADELLEQMKVTTEVDSGSEPEPEADSGLEPEPEPGPAPESDAETTPIDEPVSPAEAALSELAASAEPVPTETDEIVDDIAPVVPDEDDLGLVEPEIDAAIDELPEEAEIDDQVEAMLTPVVAADDAASAEQTGTEPDAAAASQPADELEALENPAPEDIASDVSTVDTRVEAPSTEPVVPVVAVVAAAALTGPETVEDLDAELSDLADELLEGDFDDVEEVLREHEVADGSAEEADDRLDAGGIESAPSSAAGAAPPSSEPQDDADPLDDEISAEVPSFVGGDAEALADEDEDIEDSSFEASEPEDETEHEAEETPKPSKRAKPKPEVPAVTAVRAEPKRSLANRVRLAGYAAAALASRPIERKPAYIRDIVGWFAAVTLFNAIAVWIFWFTITGPGPGDQGSATVGLDSAASATDAASSLTDAQYPPDEELTGDRED